MVYLKQFLLYASASNALQIGKSENLKSTSTNGKCLDTDQQLFWNLNQTDVPSNLVNQLRAVRGQTGSTKQVRKFVQLKQMISFILGDEWSSFDRYHRVELTVNYSSIHINDINGVKRFHINDVKFYFFRFCGYGCWCFPDGSVDIMSGSGPVLDGVDG